MLITLQIQNSRFATFAVAIIFVISVLGCGIEAQESAKDVSILPVPIVNNTAPIVWEKYKISSEKLSVMFPKLPVVNKLDQICDHYRANAYDVYANNAVYELRFYAQVPDEMAAKCSFPGSFSKSYLERLDELRFQNPTSELNMELAGRKTLRFEWKTKYEIAKRWIIDDLANDRWIELSINRRLDADFDEDRFLNSLKLSLPTGKEIGDGANTTLGDIEDNVKPKQAPNESVPDEGLAVVSKPRALYTDMARDKSAEGTVALKVVFRANGSIGSIIVVSALPFGLTEKAISAARRLVFMPKREKGIPIDVIKEIHYEFHIF